MAMRLVSVLLLCACGARQGAPLAPEEPWQRRPKDIQARQVQDRSRPALELPGEATGPFYATSKTTSALVTILEDQPMHVLRTQRFGADGNAQGPPLNSEVPNATGPLLVRALDSDVFLIVYKLHTEEDVLRAHLLSGGTLSKGYDVARAEAISWVDLLLTETGATLVWSEPQGEQATVFASSLRGEIWGAPNPLLSGASAWQVRAREGKVVAAWVAPPAGRIAQTTVYAQEWSGTEGATRHVVSKTFGAAQDWVDLLLDDEGAHIAWYMRKGAEPVAVVSTLNPAGVVGDPAPVEGLRETETLKGLLRMGAQRALELEAGSRTVLRAIKGTGRLEFSGPVQVADSHVLGALCKGTACTSALVSLERGFDAPTSVPTQDPASALRWNLQCDAQRCTYLAATAATPSAVWIRTASPVTASAAPPATTAESGKDTAVMTLTSRSDPHQELPASALALHAVSLGSTPYVGALTTDGKIVLTSGTNHSTAIVRAKPGNEFALAPWPKEDGLVVAWIGVDGNDEEVHITKFDTKLKRVNEIRLTTAAGGARAPQLVAISDGWLALWLDGRGGSQQIMATRFDRELKRLTRDEVIAPGATDRFSILKVGTTIWATWSEEGGLGLAQISSQNAARMGAPIHLPSSSQPLGAPHIYLEGDIPMLAWSEASGGGARVFTRPLEGGQASAPSVRASTSVPVEVMGWSKRGFLVRSNLRFGFLEPGGQLSMLRDPIDGAAVPSLVGKALFYARTENGVTHLLGGDLE